VSNAYLERKRAQYDSIRSTIEGLQVRAADEDRDLTDAELRSIQEQGEAAKAIASEIESLADIEARSAKVAGLAANLGGSTEPKTAVGITATDRDPGHYTRSSEHSFFKDLTVARQGDDAAARRLAEHNRALDTTGNGVGVVPPKWLAAEYDEIARQGLYLASAVRNVPLGTDPRPMSLPFQSGQAATGDQEAEGAGTGIPETDAYSSGVQTVTPVATAGKQIVSRQLLDASSPAIDALIYGDLMGDLNAKLEARVGAAVSGVGTALEIGDDGAWDSALIDAAVAVRSARKLPANIVAMSFARYGELLQLRDGNGRPLIPADSGGPVNVVGVGTVAVDGRVHGLGVVATDAITDDGLMVVLRAADVIAFSGDTLRFSYEQVAGPEAVELGVWQYQAAVVRQGTRAVKRVSVTSA